MKKLNLIAFDLGASNGRAILGHKSHMGAGSVTSNVKSDKTLVVVKNGDEKIETGLKKFGAMLGDFVEVIYCIGTEEYPCKCY